MPPAPVESPCKSVCVMADFDGERLCFGCFRTVEEIAGWRSMTPENRRRVMADLPYRQPAHWLKINRATTLPPR